MSSELSFSSAAPEGKLFFLGALVGLAKGAALKGAAHKGGLKGAATKGFKIAKLGSNFVGGKRDERK